MIFSCNQFEYGLRMSNQLVIGDTMKTINYSRRNFLLKGKNSVQMNHMG